MNSLTTFQRKMVYMGIVVVLLAPIILLGQPATSSGKSGGLIAQRRFEEDLGEASLGDVDPASATMSLVLLGLRGVAANILWMQADEEKNMKQWSQLEQTIERILLLQPHFQSVWKHQCWNLTYNVSAECDAVEDRFYWVKRGLIFLQRGVNRNQNIPELPHDVGDFCGKKIGRADERDFYRRYFVSDPDVERFKGLPDPRINPHAEDNYLVARSWYERANETADLGKVQQHKMDGPLFYAYPYRSLMDYATAKQQDAATAPEEELEAIFVDAQQKWADAYKEWTTIYGRRVFNVPIFKTLQIDGEDDELKRFAEQDGMTLQQKIDYRDRYQNMTGYRFWKLRCSVEAESDMAEAHKQLIVGRRRFRDEQDMKGAIEVLEDGLTRLDRMFDKYREPNGRNQLALDDHDLAEEALKGLLIYRGARDIQGPPLDDSQEFPGKSLWTEPELQSLIQGLSERFQRWQGGGASN